MPFYSQILTDKNRLEEINFTEILGNVQQLFADKIFKYNIIIEVNVDQNVIFNGDPLLTDFILANIIGRIIYRVPKSGKIVIKISQQISDIHLTIQDNGYSVANTAKKLVEKSFDLFMEDNNFQLLCNENGVEIEHIRLKNSINITNINIPRTYSQDEKEKNLNNVINLFQDII